MNSCRTKLLIYSDRVLDHIPMPMTFPKTINEIVQQSGYQILGHERLASRQAKFLPIPSRLHESVRNLIAQSYPDGLYGHQAKAIDAGLKGDDICLATSTASGKSLVYMVIAADMILRDNHSRVIALSAKPIYSIHQCHLCRPRIPRFW
jgi:ATP-dependent helicase YprA (DUF1998 family)